MQTFLRLNCMYNGRSRYLHVLSISMDLFIVNKNSLYSVAEKQWEFEGVIVKQWKNRTDYYGCCISVECLHHLHPEEDFQVKKAVRKQTFLCQWVNSKTLDPCVTQKPIRSAMMVVTPFPFILLGGLKVDEQRGFLGGEPRSSYILLSADRMEIWL